MILWVRHASRACPNGVSAKRSDSEPVIHRWASLLARTLLSLITADLNMQTYQQVVRLRQKKDA